MNYVERSEDSDPILIFPAYSDSQLPLIFLKSTISSAAYFERYVNNMSFHVFARCCLERTDLEIETF